MKHTIIALCAVLLLCTACSITPKEEPYTVNIDALRLDAGSTETYLDGFMSIGGLKKNNITVYYYPTEDAVCLQFKNQFMDCHQFWNSAGRTLFINALEQYKEDYAQQKLSKGGIRKNQKTYGSAYGYFRWKRTQVGIQAHGSPRIDLGYALRDKAAFFVASQQEAYYEDPIVHSRNQTSSVIRMYFSRSQADALAALFDEDYLRSLIPAGGISIPKEEVEVKDEYTF